MAGKKLQFGVKRVRHGFTLLELLIVILIVGMLAVLAVMNYTGVRKGAQLNFAVDSFINLVSQTRDGARLGKTIEVKDQLKAICSGLEFVPTNVDGVDVFTVTQFKSNYQRNIDSCIEPRIDLSSQVFGELPVNVRGIALERSGKVNSQIVILFKPPRGKAILMNSWNDQNPRVDQESLIFDLGFNDELAESALQKVRFNNVTTQTNKFLEK